MPVLAVTAYLTLSRGAVLAALVVLAALACGRGRAALTPAAAVAAAAIAVVAAYRARGWWSTGPRRRRSVLRRAGAHGREPLHDRGRAASPGCWLSDPRHARRRTARAGPAARPRRRRHGGCARRLRALGGAGALRHAYGEAKAPGLSTRAPTSRPSPTPASTGAASSGRSPSTSSPIRCSVQSGKFEVRAVPRADPLPDATDPPLLHRVRRRTRTARPRAAAGRPRRRLRGPRAARPSPPGGGPDRRGCGLAGARRGHARLGGPGHLAVALRRRRCCLRVGTTGGRARAPAGPRCRSARGRRGALRPRAHARQAALHPTRRTPSSAATAPRRERARDAAGAAGWRPLASLQAIRDAREGQRQAHAAHAAEALNRYRKNPEAPVDPRGRRRRGRGGRPGGVRCRALTRTRATPCSHPARRPRCGGQPAAGRRVNAVAGARGRARLDARGE